MRDVIVLEHANKQIQAAFEWYLSRSVSAAYGFIREIESCFHSIANEKTSYSKNDSNYHEFVLKKYPFIVVYRLDSSKNKQVVVQVFNTYQNPVKKRKFLRKNP